MKLVPGRRWGRWAPLAVSLCLATSLGCSVPSSNGPSAPPEPAPGSPAPSGPFGTVLPISTLKGRVTFNGAPLANATIRVTDALTNQAAGIVAVGGANAAPTNAQDGGAAADRNVVFVVGRQAGIIAAGGGNIIAAGGGNIIAAGGGNIIAAGGGNLVTDAQGNYSVDVAGLGTGEAARLVVSSGSASLATVVRADGPLGKGFRVLEGATASSTLITDINETTTVLSQLASGALRLTRVLNAQSGEVVIAKLMNTLNTYVQSLAQEFQRHPGLANEAVRETGAENDPKASAALGAILGNLGMRQALHALNREVIVGVTQGMAAGNTAPDQAEQQRRMGNVTFAGTGLQASLDGTTLTILTPSGHKVALPVTDQPGVSAVLQDQPSSGGATPWSGKLSLAVDHVTGTATPLSLTIQTLTGRAAGPLQVKVTSRAEPAGELVSLVENPAGSGTFTATLPLEHVYDEAGKPRALAANGAIAVYAEAKVASDTLTVSFGEQVLTVPYEEPASTVTGTVTVAGTARGRALVRLLGASGFMRETASRADGSYAIYDVPAGTYQLVFTVDGAVRQTHTVTIP